jgi:hypothetical protein
VTDCSQVFAYLRTGNKSRKVANTTQNERSSRSHSILTFYIEKRVPFQGSSNKTQLITSKLNLVDLAGSEKFQSKDHDRAVESCNINQSLSTLAKVIDKLATKNGSNQHIPYRDSKLTRYASMHTLKYTTQ